MRPRQFKSLRYAVIMCLLVSILSGIMMDFTVDNALAEGTLMEKNEEAVGFGVSLGADYKLAQSFIASGDYQLIKVALLVFDFIGVNDLIKVEIWSNNPGPSVPMNQLSSTAINNTADGEHELADFSFETDNLHLSEGETYWIVARSEANIPDGYLWVDSMDNLYPEGIMAFNNQGKGWQQVIDNDLVFWVYGQADFDFGVKEVDAPKSQDLYVGTEIISTIRNYGISGPPGPYEVNCQIEDPMGSVVLDEYQLIQPLNPGEEDIRIWNFVPLSEGIHTITVQILISDNITFNNEMVIFMDIKAAAVLKLHDNIEIDGTPDDWYGDPPTAVNSWTVNEREFIWKDAADDDNGDGDYVYPDNSDFKNGCLDLLEFRVAVDYDSINFLLEFQSIDNSKGDMLGFSEQIIQILIDTDRSGGGRVDTLRNARVKLDSDKAWEYALWVNGLGEGYLENEEHEIDNDVITAMANTSTNVIEISIPALDTPPFETVPDFERWGYVVLVGAQFDKAIPYPLHGSQSGFMEVDMIPTSISGGGGLDYGADSNVYDMAFADPQDEQLNNYEYLDKDLVLFGEVPGSIDSNIDQSERWAQSFIVEEVSLLTSVALYGKDFGFSKGPIFIDIQDNDDNNDFNPDNDIPGPNLLTEVGVELMFPDTYGWVKVDLTAPLVLIPGEKYWIVTSSLDNPGHGSYWKRQTGNLWPDGHAARSQSSQWTARSNDDMLFATYCKEMTIVDAYHTAHFAPLVINEVSSAGAQDEEWISLYFNGTKDASSLDMENWQITDQDGETYIFPIFNLFNGDNVTIFTGSGTDTSTELFWNNPFEIWDDPGDDVLLKTEKGYPVDYMNYTDGMIHGDPPPVGIPWESQGGESLPRNPQAAQKLFLRIYGQDNDYYSDWKLKTNQIYKVKTLYLFDDETLDPNDPYDHMDTKPPEQSFLADFDFDFNPGLTLDRSGPLSNPGRYQEFNLTPILARNLSIVDAIEVELWIDDDGAGAQEELILTLYDCDGLTKSEISKTKGTIVTDTKTAEDGPDGWQIMEIVFPYIDYTVPEGNYISLHLMMDTSNSTKDLWLAYNSTDQASCLRTIPTNTVVNVEWVKTFDLSEVEKINFDQGEDVLIKANISDPFGSYDITGANITIRKPTESGFPAEIAMTLDETDPTYPSAWKIFKYTHSDTTQTGIYNVRIKGIESNGVVHYLNTTFNILVNNPPYLIDSPVAPASGYQNETFNFTVQYFDDDDDAPGEVTVNITNRGTFSLIALDPFDLNYTDGKDYYIELSGFYFGTSYSYHFYANDTKGEWTETSEIYDEPYIINSPPVLLNPAIDYDSGNASTTFTYTVTYKDLENQPPSSITVYIFGPSHSGEWDMLEVDPGDDNYTDGKDYEYSYTGFVNGSYSFYITAYDWEGDWDETAEDFRPLVINSFPILMEPEVVPLTGYIDTEFTFTVTYYDLDNHPPQDVYVNITGPSHSGDWLMTEVDPGDMDYTDGKEYEWSDTDFTMGSYQFHCAASDSQGAWRETSVVSKPTVLNSCPILSDHNLLPTVGDPGVTLFNYVVNYTDLDGHIPLLINVTIFGPDPGNYSMTELDAGDTDVTDGKAYVFTTTLALAGTYSYRIDAIDALGLWAIAIIDSGPSVGQEKPVLSQPDVSPRNGFRTTVYNFTVNFTDQQNDPAGVIRLNLSGPVSGNFTMLEVDPSDVNTIDGKYFYFEHPDLTKGSYEFIIWGEDIKGNPASSTIKHHPTVRNSAPELSGGFINESEYGGSWFNFTVIYTDVDDDIPSEMMINISGLGAQIMMEVDPGDSDYTDGKEYYYNTTFPKGTYSYHFAARDSGIGIKWTETPEDIFKLINNLPIFQAIDITPAIGYGEDEFNFTVNIIDDDGDATTLHIYIQDEVGSPFIMLEVDPLDVDTKDGKEFYYARIFSKGNYNYNFSAFDTEQEIKTSDQILNVRNNPPTIPTPDIDTTIEDNYYNNDYEYSDRDGDTITWNLDTNATWLNFDPPNGEIYGTPTNFHVGIFYVNISCDDGDGGVGYHYFTLSVTNALPLFTTSPKGYAYEDIIHIDDFNCIDDGQGIITYSYQSNATWLGIDSGSGILSGTPNNLNVGWYWVNVTVDDGNGGTDEINYTLTVNNTPPNILTTPLRNALEDALMIDDFNCDDDSQGNITYSMETNGTWFNPINPFSGTISGTPTNSDVGKCWVKITVTDGNGGSDSLNYTITVFNTNDPPEITAPIIDVTWAFEDTLYSVDYDAMDIDPTHDTLTWSFQTNASWLSMNLTSGEIYGTPTNGDIGSYWVEVTISDGKGGSEIRNFTLNVGDENDPPQIITPNVEFCFEDSYYEVDYDFIDIDDPSVTWSLDTNGSWLSINPTTGVLNGTPDNGDVGWCWLNVTCDDGRTGKDYAEFIIWVNNTAPLITTTPDEYATENLVHIDNFDSNDDGQGNVFFTYETNATWFGFDPVTGVLIGTANNTHVGSYWVEVTVHDGNGGTDSVNYTLTVINVPPSILTVPLQTATEDSFFFDNYNCDEDGEGSIIYSLDTNATWLSINPTTGVLSGTPSNSHVGWFWVNVSVTDGNGGLDFRQYDVTVLNVNDDPQITTSNVEFAFEDILYSVDYDAVDIDPTKDTLTWSMQTNASWLNFSTTTGELWGTPLNGDIGWFWVNVSVSDGIGGLTWTKFNITVNEENDPPDIISPNIEFAVEDTYYAVDYNFTDLDDPIVSWELTTNAPWLSINSETGLLYGTPDNTEVGSYWVNVRVEDNRGGSDFTNFTLTVNNTPPTITNIQDEFVDEDQYHQDDFDCDDDGQGTITYSLSTNATWLSFDPATEILNGTPDNTEVGWYWVNITVYDGNGGSDFINYTITVNNAMPTINTTPLLDAYEDSQYLMDFNCIDDGQGNIEYSLDTNAPWLSMDPVTGIIYGIPENDDVGPYWVNVTVLDGKGGLHYVNYTLTVINTNDLPDIVPGYLEFVDEDSFYFFDYEYSDIDGDIVTWRIESNGTWLHIDQNTGGLSGIPRNSDVGSFYVNIIADDGNGGLDNYNFTVYVNNTNDPPSQPQLLLPSDDSTVNSTTPTFSWSPSVDPDYGDSIAYYIVQYSTSSDFLTNVVELPYIANTFFTPIAPLSDKTVYYWRVQAVDMWDAESGYQSSHFVFLVDTGYFAPAYIGGLKSVALQRDGIWQIDLDDYFRVGSKTEGLTYSCNYNEVKIDPETHVATWTPKSQDDYLTDVTFTLSDGNTEVESFPIDLTVTSELTIWDRIFWPYSLVPMIFFMLLGAAIMARKWKNRPFVEEVFFISENGRLISHATVKTDEEVDEDILSGMLTGVKDLITDAFVRDESSRDTKGLHKLEFGDSNIMLEKGGHFFIAIVFKGIENRKMLSKIKKVIKVIENRYGNTLANWDGDMDSFEGADKIIATLLSTEALTKEEMEKIEETDSEKEEMIIEKWSAQMMESVDDENYIGYGEEYEGQSMTESGEQKDTEREVKPKKKKGSSKQSKESSEPPWGKLNRIK